MIDFNDVGPGPPDRPSFDLDEIVRRLRDRAEQWVPQHFPNGRRDGDEWRLANIRGDAPRKTGSCVITLKGEHAGDWIEFDDKKGGGPISALEQATGLCGHQRIEYAAELTGVSPSNGADRSQLKAASGSAKSASSKNSKDKQENTEREIKFILSRAVPLAGTVGETYLKARGLIVPDTDDLLFHPDLTYWDTKTSYPGLVSIVRDRDGAPIAIHRTYLAPDGSDKADVPKPRKFLGSTAGGAIRLADIGDGGVVGLSEGIENAISVTRACPELPAWAAMAAGNLKSRQLPDEAERVVILADNDGKGIGLEAAGEAAAIFHASGRRVWIAAPPNAGDDFNKVLQRDGAEAVRAIVEAAVEWTPDLKPATDPDQPQPPLILSKAEPLTSAEKFIAERYTIGGQQVLYHHAGVF